MVHSRCVHPSAFQAAVRLLHAAAACWMFDAAHPPVLHGQCPVPLAAPAAPWCAPAGPTLGGQPLCAVASQRPRVCAAPLPLHPRACSAWAARLIELCEKCEHVSCVTTQHHICQAEGPGHLYMACRMDPAVQAVQKIQAVRAIHVMQALPLAASPHCPSHGSATTVVAAGSAARHCLPTSHLM
jgi:hypothetical protein